jgi:hypothetical protein
MANIQVAVINSSTAVTDAQVAAVIPALQIQVHRDFAPVWGVDADLTFVGQGGSPASGSWWLTVLDDSDQAGALGYHDLTSEGLPLGKVFAGSDIQGGTQWTVTASHELLELLADPDVNMCAYSQNSSGNTIFYAYEVCDACEADNFGYNISGTLVSDFVFPTWFESFHQPGSTQFDFGKSIQQPFLLSKGGYISTLDPSNNNGWTQAVSQEEDRRYTMRAPIGSRRERRRIPRNEWLRSKPQSARPK